MINEDAIEDLYELTPMQQGMLFHSLLEEGTGIYVEQMSCDVRGDLPLPRWRAAWQVVLGRHGILRSGFMWEGLEKPLQVVFRQADLPWHVDDLRGLGEAAQEAHIEAYAQSDRRRGFVLDQAPLVRCALFRLDDHRHRFLWTYHHVLLDGWCFSIVLREVLETVEKGPEALPPPSRPYRDYITWLQGQDGERARSFWTETLRGFDTPTPLPLLERRDLLPEPGAAQPEVVRHLPRPLTARLTTYAKEHRLTLNTVVQGAWALVLGRAADTDDVVFGVTVSGRPADLEGSESIVGLFINTVPLRARLDDRLTPAQLLANLQSAQGALEPYGYSSLADIQVWSEAPHDHPLFESLLVFENYPIDRSALLERSDLEITGIRTNERTNYPLTVVAIPGAELELRVMYDPRLFSRRSADRIIDLLAARIEDLLSVGTLAEIGLADEDTRRVVLEWGTNARDHGDQVAPVHALVAQSAAAAPSAIALVGPGGETLTYAELLRRARLVAARLRELGVGPGSIAGLHLGRSVDYVVGALGVLQAGAAYLPLDPGYPAERLSYVASDARPAVVLTSGGERPPFLPLEAKALDVTQLSRGPGEATALPSTIGPEGLAYVVYTSGSTGRPKGVLVTHANLHNLIDWHTEAFSLTAADRTTQLASVSFDAAAWEIWPTLARGATLLIVPQELTAAPEELARWVSSQRVTVGFFPTPVAEVMVALPWPRDTSLRIMLTGGDRLHAFPPADLPFELVNNYGPTETTVVATSGLVPRAPGQGLPSIGRPVANARIYILDRARRPVPPGITGELFIGGRGVAGGYLNRPDLTAERFVPDPFAGGPGSPARMYASGDLASFNSDGTITFHGRKDRQVQVRGVRVEPGEIEATLAAHPGVEAAAVVGEGNRQNGDVRLLAFVACPPGQSSARPEPSSLLGWLAARLPAPWIPARLLVLDALPLTQNGKVDHAALLALASAAETPRATARPRTPHEEVVAALFAAVLERGEVGVDEDFFDLGGHSLKATQVVARAREAFGVEVPVRLIFEHRTVASFAAAVAGGNTTAEPIPPVDLSLDLPAAPGQERLWFLDSLQGPSAAYNVPLVLELEDGSTLDVPALERALHWLVERHEALRTTFGDREGAPVQRIGPVPAAILQLSDLPLGSVDAAGSGSPGHPPTPGALEAAIREEVNRPFDLARGPLFRARLLRRGSSTVLLINQHHIIADAWSLAILLRELGQAYGAFSRGAVPDLPRPAVRYADWAAWQHRRLAGGLLAESVEHWRAVLAGAPPVLTLPSDRPRPPVQSFRGASHTFSMPAPIGARLAEVAKSQGASLFMTTLAAFAAYLARRSGQDDLVLGIPAANRDRRETEGVVGFFLNTLALRLDLSGDPPFSELLQRVRRAALDAYAHQDLPFEQLVAALGAPRDLAYNPLFQVMFTVQGESSEQLALGDLPARMRPFETAVSKFDLTLVVEPRGEALAAIIEYSTDLFDGSSIERLAAHLQNLFSAVGADPELKLHELPLSTPAELDTLATFSRGRQLTYPRDRTVPDLLREAAERTPESLALTGPGGATYSHAELHSTARRIAAALVARGVVPGSIVGVAIPRSPELVIAELATWLAGAAYLPLDLGHPAERLAFITRDAGPRVILTSGTRFPIADHGADELDLGELLRAGPHPEARSLPRATPSSLAYVIYTSGSTGAPKGVLVNHASLANLISWHNDEHRVTARDRATQLAAVAFDATVWEIWPPLAAGGSLHVVPAELVTRPRALVDWLVGQGITICFLPTPLAEVVLAEPWPSGGALRIMHVAGDRLHVYAPPGLPFALINDYGPTETTVCATSGVVPTSGSGLPSIGRPIANTTIHLLDHCERPVPPGSVGELYIGGAGVALGYLNRPELTEEKFRPDPFSLDPGARLYASGDLGSFNPDGTINFLGRRDRQVKIRGVRIEPGEIESALTEHPAVSAAAVVTEGDGRDARLVAFVAAGPVAPEPELPSTLSRFLAGKLPPAMMPSRIVVLAELPMTRNGKVDHRALVALAPAAGSGARHVDPRTPEEELLAAIWSEVLGRGQLGVEDDFFALGGHSLRATQVVARVRESLGVELPVRAVFEERTIAGLASTLHKYRSPGEAIPRAALEEGAPLAPGQESLYFLHTLGEAAAAYSVPLAVELTGPLDVPALTEAVRLLVERHEALRTVFVEQDGVPVQKVTGGLAEPLVLEEVEPSALARRLAEELARPFSLAQGPVFRAHLFRKLPGPGEALLLLNAHHIIIDAWSVGIILRELCVAYSSLIAGSKPALPELPVRYADWAAWQRRRLAGDQLAAGLSYWTSTLAGAPDELALPADHPRPERQSFRGRATSFELPAPLGAAYAALAREQGVSLFMAMLAAFGAYLARLGGQDDLVIGSPAANRDRRETEGVVGYFLNTLPFRLDLSGDPTFTELLARVRRTALEAYAHQEVPFEHIVRALGRPRDLSRNPLFQVMFTLQGEGGGELAFSGLDARLPSFESPTSKFDLTLFVEPRGEALACVLEYSTDLFEEATASRLISRLGRVFAAIAEDPTRRLSSIPALAPEEELLLAGLDRTGEAAPPTTLDLLFDAQARATPDAVAVVHGEHERTYAELDLSSRALANRLLDLGVGPGARVALCLDRSITAVTAILAVIRAGGAYVPLDPAYPRDRLGYMLEDSGAGVLLLEEKHAELFPSSPPGLTIVVLGSGGARLLRRGEGGAPPRVQGSSPSDLAYVIYTSGSTGRPKGVAMPHRPLAQLIEWQRGQGPARRTLQFAPLSFDVSFQELFSTWCTGGTLVLVDEATRRDPDALVLLLEQAGIERLFLPAVALHHLAQAALRAGAPIPRLVEVITAGDQLRVTEPIRRWFTAGKKRLFNHYGPTESHVVTAHALAGEPAEWPGLPPIGLPISGSRVFLLDAHRRPVPPGVAGELYLAGACLADGYLGKPELTLERFQLLELPAGAEGTSRTVRVYRTGDLARLDARGELEFLGRADDQVKVRGFRVELGEIERVLCAHASVRDAAVIMVGARGANPEAERRLAAYFTWSDAAGGAPDEGALAAWLRGQLPEYMVPSLLISLPSLPRTPSGKVDRRSLPEPSAPEAGGAAPSPGAESATTSLVRGAFQAVLGRTSVGARDNFFELGGHSLLAMSLVARLRETFGVELRVAEVFEHPTPAGLAALIDRRRAGGEALVPRALEPAPSGAAIPASFSQERLWFLDQLHPGSPAYNLPVALRLRGALDVPALQAALTALVVRHPVLGIRFVERDEHVFQEPRAEGPSPFELVELGEVSDEQLRARVREEAGRPFDLSRGPLFRARLLRISPADHVVVSTMHHTVGDGWSISVLVRELSLLYAAHASGQPLALPPLRVTFLDHAYEERGRLQGDLLERRLDHWRERLRGVPEVLSLPTDRPRPPKATLRGGNERLSLGPDLSRALETLALRVGATPFMVLLAGFGAYLSRITGEEDLVIGTPVANRDREELEALVGFFVGTLPIRFDVAKDPTFLDLVLRARAAALDAYAYQDVPLEKIVDAVATGPSATGPGAGRSLSHAPLFQVMLVLQNTPESALALPGLAVEVLDLELDVSKSDLTLVLQQGAGGLSGALEYSADLFDAAHVRRLAEGLLTFLSAAAAAPEVPVSTLELLPPAERAQVLGFSLGDAGPWPTVQSVLPARFEALARRAPESIALQLGERTLSYGALDAWANRIAHRLLRMGAGKERLVALSVPRSFEAIAAILGVWKAGAAYLPLDPTYPRARLDDILADSGAELLVSTRAVEARWHPELPTLWLDEPLGEVPPTRPELTVRPEDMAYVIYTSGSTGRPKGVVLEHRGLANVPEIHRAQLGVDERAVVLQFASISFDASVWEIVMALGSGGRLVLVPADTLLAGDELAAVLEGAGVTHAALPPTTLRALPDDRSYPALRQLISAGEACGADLVERWASGGRQLYNGYGPTESTICTTLGLCAPGAIGAPPIGRPALNLEAWVLDPRGRLLPIGVPGELHIGGAGLARGYLGRDELTRAKFIEHPLRAGARLYKSGDLVRWRPSGELDYLGRIDDQVKLRGFRVELGEIAAALLEHPEVAHAHLAALGDGNTRVLVAYLVPATPGAPPSRQALLDFARSRLPEYMVPAELVFLPELPLTPNGKVDKRRLPAPALEAGEARREHLAPRTPTEEVLAAIWAELLGRPAIGADDHFFELGGHSLLAAQVMSRARRAFGAELPLSAIFENPTLAGLARVVEARRGSAALPPIQAETPAGDEPLSFAQERLRFLAELEGDSPAYNIPIALALRGPISARALEESLRFVVRRHSALRTSFPLEGGRPVARPASDGDLSSGAPALVLEEATGAHLATRLAEESARPFQVSTGPVLRAHLFHSGADEHVLLVVVHHIVADGWSVGVLLRELALCFAALSRGAEPDLPPLPIQYSDYSRWQRRWLDGAVRATQLGYWSATLAGAPPVLELPADRPRPSVSAHRGGAEKIELAASTTRALAAVCRAAGVTPYMALLAGFAAYLGRIAGTEDLVIGSPFAGRRLPETEPLIGFFVNTLPIRVDLSGDPTFLELLERVRRRVLEAHEHQDVPFERLVEELRPERVLGASPIFQVMFALQQPVGRGLALPGLTVEPLSVESGSAKFDLTLSLMETEAGLGGALEYDRELFDRETITAMIGQLDRFLSAALAAPKLRLEDLELLSADELRRLLPPAPEPRPELLPVHLAIATQARRTPEAIAVEHQGQSLTYRELDLAARHVAAALRQSGLAPGALAGVALERSLDMMTGILGVLYAGGAYLPLDPSYPEERLRFMLQDSGARVLLARREDGERFSDLAEVILDLTEHPPAEAARRTETKAQPEPLGASAGLAYCLYTSGSTGQPKGVLIDHQALAHHMAWMGESLPVGPRDRVLQRTSISFDASVWELFLPLMYGATLVLAPPDLGADTEALARILSERRITVLQLVPSLLGALVREPGLRRATSLRRLCAGGEPLPAHAVARVFELLGPEVEVWNLYGPTECTIDATAHRSLPEDTGQLGAIEPIGRPIRGMTALVLDGRLRPVPDGVAGELYLLGPCVGRGYHNRPELTRERFIEHTFSNGARVRMYRTGDVVRRRRGGLLEFLGRVDRQVKLRGFRIELGEIEAALAKQPGVREAAVSIQGTGAAARLVAYLSQGEVSMDTGALRAALGRQLAPHMVPGYFVVLDELPHAPNGKVDLRALAAIEVAPAAERRPIELDLAPRDTLELELVRIFEEVLELTGVGVEESFFELGGHSLLALELQLAIEQRLGRRLPLVRLFQSPTPAELARIVRDDLPAGTPSPLVPLTASARRRLAGAGGDAPALFLVPGGGSTPFYLLSLARRLEGADVFGLQPRGLDGTTEPHRTIEDAAAWFAEAIRAVQPRGPYHLGGHSVGGHAAYEVAQQLREAGEEVALVAMLDTIAPFPEAVRPMGAGWDLAQWLVQIAGVMEGFFSVRVGLDPEQLRRMTEPEQVEVAVERLQSAGILPPGAGVAHVRGILEVARAQDGAQYHPRLGHRLPLAVYRAEEKSGEEHPAVGALLGSESLGWDRFTGGAVEAHVVPGSHLTLVREPHVAALATLLRRRLGLPEGGGGGSEEP